MASLIRPKLQGQALRREIHEARINGDRNHFDVWWVGQSGFIIQWNGQCVLFDPYLSDSLTKKYSGTNKPHVRMSELVIDPSLLDMIDIVTSSHNHTDHLDGETLKPLLKSNPDITFLIPEANRDFVAERVGCAKDLPIGLTDGETIRAKDFLFYGVPSAHNTVERDDQGRCIYMGYVVSFGNFTIYHSGDTLLFDGLVEHLKKFKVDVAFLPINGNDPARGVAGNLNAAEAVKLGREVGAQFVVPHHYHMFEFNTADPSDFEREALNASQPYKVLELGQRWTNSK